MEPKMDKDKQFAYKVIDTCHGEWDDRLPDLLHKHDLDQREKGAIDELEKVKESLDSEAREVINRRIQMLRSGNGEKGCQICGSALTKEEQNDPCPQCKKLTCGDCWENEKCCKAKKEV